MSFKRVIQIHLARFKNLLKTFQYKTKHEQIMFDSVTNSHPLEKDKALFNFTIDFELVWGNGNLGGCGHSFEKRVSEAKQQNEVFTPFLQMLDEIDFPISWALVGKLLEPDLRPEAEFKPSWYEGDWYSFPVESHDPNLWSGVKCVNAITSQKVDHEILSHGFAHIDFADEACTKEIARNDIKLGIKALEDFGLRTFGFVYPCNRVNFPELLQEFNLHIYRGSTQDWDLSSNLIQTPKGFWISPAFMTKNSVIKAIDIAISNKSFAHPWMHLVECTLQDNDIENFYKPIFLHIKKKIEEGKIDNVLLGDLALKNKVAA